MGRPTVVNVGNSVALGMRKSEYKSTIPSVNGGKSGGTGNTSTTSDSTGTGNNHASVGGYFKKAFNKKLLKHRNPRAADVEFSQNEQINEISPQASTLMAMIHACDWALVREHIQTKKGAAEFSKAMEFDETAQATTLNLFGTSNNSISAVNTDKNNLVEGIESVGSTVDTESKDLKSSFHGSVRSGGSGNKIKTISLTPTLLHLVCTLNPPVQFVQRILSHKPAYSSLTNNMEQTPLHLACAYGASPQVVQCLLKHNKKLAGRLDHRGRTPLHVLCEIGIAKEDEEEEYLDLEDDEDSPVKECLGLLIYAFPEAVAIHDAENKTPLDYAVAQMAHPRIILQLEKYSARTQQKA